MRRGWIIIGLVILVVALISFNRSLLPNHSTGNTVEEAIQKSGRKVEKIVHTEAVKDGVVVFYIKSIGNGGQSNASGFVKKTLWGWEWAWGGEYTDAASKGFSVQNFPYTKGTPFPLLFGEIKDQRIKQIKILEKDGTKEKEGKIVGNGKDLMWFTLLDKAEGPNFTVIGLSSEGSTLYTETINTDESSVTSTKPLS